MHSRTTSWAPEPVSCSGAYSIELQQDPMADSKLTRKDFITSIVLIVFSLTIVVMSYTMPRLERRGIDPLSAPGVVPGMIGMVLLCLALILFFRSIRNGGYRFFQDNGRSEKTVHQGAIIRVTLTLFISLIYSIGFLGRLNYSVSTGIFIFTFICLFEMQAGKPLWEQRKIFFFALLQAVAASALITLVFQNLFLIDLP